MAAEKKAFVLRVQPELMKALETWAADDFRSVNGQIEFLLHKSLQEAGRLKTTRSKQEKKPG
jgi:hypothetical protein